MDKTVWLEDIHFEVAGSGSDPSAHKCRRAELLEVDPVAHTHLFNASGPSRAPVLEEVDVLAHPPMSLNIVRHHSSNSWSDTQIVLNRRRQSISECYSECYWGGLRMTEGDHPCDAQMVDGVLLCTVHEVPLVERSDLQSKGVIVDQLMLNGLFCPVSHKQFSGHIASDLFDESRRRLIAGWWLKPGKSQ